MENGSEEIKAYEKWFYENKEMCMDYWSSIAFDKLMEITWGEAWNAALEHASKARVPQRKEEQKMFGGMDIVERTILEFNSGYNACIDEFLRLNPGLENK